MYAVIPVDPKVKVELNSFDNMTISGITPRLNLNEEYKIQIVEKNRYKGVMTYEIKSVRQELPTTQEGQKMFLKTLLTENQVDAIYKVYPDHDIIQLIKDDSLDYKKVHGVGEKSYKKIRQRILDNIEYEAALSHLGQYDLGYNLIVKLQKHFGSTALLLQNIEANPYSMVAVSGIGFKKADQIARSMKYDMKSPHRIKSAIKYIIEEEQGKGHTYITQKDLMSKADDLLGVDEDLIFNGLHDCDDVIILDDKIALENTYEREVTIAKFLKKVFHNSSTLDFDVDTFIAEQETELGIKLTDQQKSLFSNIKYYNVNFLVGFAGCVDRETEFFDGYGWKKISEYKEGDKVLQYNVDGTAELIEPLKYHKLPETKMTLIKNMSGSVNQCLSDEHDIVYRTSKGHLAKLPFLEFKKRHNESPNGFYGRFYTTFKYSGEGIDLTDEQLRVMVMVIADGYFKNDTALCRVRVKKERKKIRVRKLLNEANIPFNEQDAQDNYSIFTFTSPLRVKTFDSSWYHCSQHQLQIICDEVLHWDGSVSRGRDRFSSNVKESAEFVQFAFSATGRRATIYENDRTGETYKDSKYIRKTKEYGVHISKNKWVSLQARRESNKTEFIEVVPEDGYKYCFTLPSGMWVMRREGRICVTGNCGKSQLQKLLINLLDKLGLTYRLLSPTGKAAKILSKYTGRDVSTIHRAIGLGKEQKDAQHELWEDFIIIDETSMLDVFLAASTFRKIKNPNVRLLFIGDPFQIPSVSAGNFLYDMVESHSFPVTMLDIVFRQSEGGILDLATKMRKKKSLLAMISMVSLNLEITLF